MPLNKTETKTDKFSSSVPASNKVIISSNNKQNISRGVPFTVVEAYKTIRTNLLFLLGRSSNHVLTFSSSNAGEGKSTTSINVAVAFAQLGGRVLVIDADMRRSSIHKKLKLDNSTGLSNVIAGFCEYKDAINTYNSNLDILTAGPIPPNPSEMLDSPEFDKLIDNVKNDYDYVIIDTPPINVVSDALVIAPKTSGLVLVVRTGFTPYDSLEHTISSAKFANISILGTILNGSNPTSSRYYKYKRYNRNKTYDTYNYKYEKK